MTINTETLIQVDHLSRYYGDTCAVNDVSFHVDRGEVVGLLGPNGAGKTSAMQIISGNLAPSTGQVRINGIDILDSPKKAKAELGYLPEQPPLYKELSVNEYLSYCARLNRVKKTDIADAVHRARRRCGLDEAGDRLIGNLSKGFQQRVGIAQAIIHNPAVIILDEPTVGLDPIQIREIRELIHDLGKEHGVILSTHILPEVQAVCDRFLIINKGRIAMAETIDDLDVQLQARSLILATRRPIVIDELLTLDGVEGVDALDAGRYRIHFSPGKAAIDTGSPTTVADTVAIMAANNHWGLYELIPEQLTLEQIFIDITCKETGGNGAGS
ncbi:MAG: ABC transporter ATP-binding protein [Gammaproteobacteria bacterium]|nr:MAG: ABC transporter ATP-binding protein [Gammaproteobacteria bacterium]